MLHSSTICAVATATGVGGIAVLRISGQEALSIVSSLFRAKGGKTLKDHPRKALYGEIWYNGELLDDVVATAFPAPHSYTGENVVEISCHGSVYIRQTLLSALLAHGCTMAMPGEFTQRAYLNGKMDLSRAEAVADLITSETQAQHRMAHTQLRGGYSAELNQLRDALLRLTALMELELDFSEEDVEFADRGELLSLLDQLESRIQKLTESFRLGNAIKRGIPVAIVGATNVGKSTLLNALLGEERAIVSDIHGTTRDTIEDTITIDGYLFRFVDTAGLRETSDTIEAIGIERSYQKMSEASIRLLLLDLSRLDLDHLEHSEHLDQIRRIITERTTEGLLLLLNKSDLLSSEHLATLQERLPKHLGEEIPMLTLSARDGIGIDSLKSVLIALAQLPDHTEGDIVVSNARHQHLFLQSLEALSRVREGLEMGLPTDLLTQDLRLAITYIGEITGGTITSDQVLHHIFANFCIGK